MLLNKARQAATTWSDADHQKAIEQLECDLHQVIPAILNLFNAIFQHHEREPLQEVCSKATGPRSIFTNQRALMKTAAEYEALEAANITPDKGLQFQICLSIAGTEATTWRLADTERVTIQLARENIGITSNEQKRFKKEFSIRMIEFEAWWETIGIQTLRKTIEQRVIHFRYSKMYLISHILESIRGMGSGDNFTTNISEWLLVLATGPNSRVGSGYDSTRNRTMATGLTTRKPGPLEMGRFYHQKPGISSSQFWLRLSI